eukprot:GSMAST32.ASY1.ANO1.196.1 assembled CDS
MSSKSLSRCKLAPKLLAKLNAAGLSLCVDVLCKNEFELLDLLDIPLSVVREVKVKVARALAPKPNTALKLWIQAEKSISNLETGLVYLDSALCGGIPVNGITELAGPSGVGKTQFCLTAAVLATLHIEKRPSSFTDEVILYLDSEQKFSAKRLVEIAKNRLPHIFNTTITNNSNTDNLRLLAGSVVVTSPATTTDLMTNLGKEVESLIIEKSIKLIILDSVAFLARKDFLHGQLVKRQLMLGALASRLKYLAEMFHIPVIVTNQVFSDGNNKNSFEMAGMTHIPALGNTWSHCVNTRLFLTENIPLSDTFNGQCRQVLPHNGLFAAKNNENEDNLYNVGSTLTWKQIVVAKCPIAGKSTINFTITDAGPLGECISQIEH